MNDFMMDYDKFKRTWSVKTELPVEFKLTYSADIFNPENKDIANLSDNKRRIVVIDEEVYVLYKDKISSYFTENKLDVHLIYVNCKEENKTWETLNHILNEFEKIGVLRRE
jgi:3-dehydroquinate synthetase